MITYIYIYVQGLDSSYYVVIIAVRMPCVEGLMTYLAAGPITFLPDFVVVGPCVQNHDVCQLLSRTRSQVHIPDQQADEHDGRNHETVIIIVMILLRIITAIVAIIVVVIVIIAILEIVTRGRHHLQKPGDSRTPSWTQPLRLRLESWGAGKRCAGNPR